MKLLSHDYVLTGNFLKKKIKQWTKSGFRITTEDSDCYLHDITEDYILDDMIYSIDLDSIGCKIVQITSIEIIDNQEDFEKEY